MGETLPLLADAGNEHDTYAGEPRSKFKCAYTRNVPNYECLQQQNSMRLIANMRLYAMCT